MLAEAAAEELLRIYDSVEPYESIGEELREAFVEGKKMLLGSSSAYSRARHGEVTSESMAGSSADPQVEELENKLGSNVLSSLEQSMSSDCFRQRLECAQQCQPSDTGCDELNALLCDYVLVTQQDAIDAMAVYLAAWLSNIPEARGMPPAELQAALLATIRDLKRTRLQTLWTYGKYAYRGAGIGYSALTIYQNPWLIRAVLSAMWSAGIALCGVIKI